VAGYALRHGLAHLQKFSSMKINRLGNMGLVGLVLMLAGCASISVEPGTAVATQQKPDKVYVETFSAEKGEFNVDREGTELAEFKSGLQAMMTAGITTDLTKRLIPAEAASKNTYKHREHAWLIRGQFVKVNQGSRLLRGAIGFGAGGTKLETKVQVYDLSTGDTNPFLTFSTTGGSNAEPGALPTLATDPLSIVIEAAGGAGNVAHGLSEDTARTSREITAELSDYMYRSRWIPEDKWIQPKAYSN
jgi:Domain of unknown function (DUF4410)